MAPLKIAETIAAHLPPAEFVGKVEVVAPGYINFTLAEAWLAKQVTLILENGATWANLRHGNDVRVQVEHGSANPTGPITVGSARNVVIGDTIANLLDAAGYDVQREYYVNDAGSQIRHFGESLYARMPRRWDTTNPFPKMAIKAGTSKTYLKRSSQNAVTPT